MFLQIFIQLFFLNLAFGLKCPNYTKTSSMPNLDKSQYSYSVEISVPDQNLTLDAYEYFDHENDTVTLYVQRRYPNNLSDVRQVVYDYRFNQTFVVDTMNGSKSCLVHDLNSTILPHQPSLFGVGIEDGPLAVNYSFYWNGPQKSSYMGVEEIDGIKTNRYQTCLSFMNGTLTYLVDVYFSLSDWSMPTGQEAPVLLKLNATDASNKSFLYYFKFSSYHNSHFAPMWTPQKPSGLICRGRKDNPMFPTINNTQFFDTIQLMSPASNTFNDITIGYDYDRKIVKEVVGLSSPQSKLYDFNQGLLYNIAMPSMKCSVKPIPLFFEYATVVNKTSVKMRDAREDIQTSNLTYGGKTTFRGILCDLWIAQSPIVVNVDPVKNITAMSYIDFYIATKKWNNQIYLAGNKITKITQNTTNSTSIVYSHVISESRNIPSDFFDIRACFNQSSSETIVLKFAPSFNNDIEENFLGFKNALVSTVAKHINVSSTRVLYDNHGVYKNASKSKDKSSGLFVWITVLGVPSVKGNAVNMVPEANLSVALSKLKKVVSLNKLQIDFKTTKMVSMTAFHNYLKNQTELLFPPQAPPAPAPVSSNGFSGGAVAGIAIGLFIAGFVLGLVVYYFRSRRRGQYAYAMQD